MSADKVELRGLAPAALAQALDALGLADGQDRNSYIVKILDAHVRAEVHKLTVRQRMLRGNPYLSEADSVAADAVVYGSAHT
jgi:hypothetical protein